MKAPPPNFYPDNDFWTRPYLFGDLGRAKLKKMGIDLSLQLVDEAVGNATGGLKRNTAQAGQFALGAKFDLQKLAGVQGGLIGLTITDRFGQNLNTTAQIPALMLTNEVFGRGNVVRLTEFYYQQDLFNGWLQVKAGRLPVGSDFFFQNCEFLNLTFCGGQPGNIQGGYIINWPVSQWGGVVHANLTKELQLSVGIYDADSRYLDTDTFDNFFGRPPALPADGTLVVSELTWSPNFGNGLTGSWRLGGWYDSASSIDGGLPGIINTFTIPIVGGSVVVDQSAQNGRYGIYGSILQRVTNEGHNGGPQGWYTFFNASFADHRTSFQDWQVAGGVKHTGTFAFRPLDEVGVGLGTTHVNSAAIANPNADGNEVAFEAWYGWQATGWLNLKFDLQYVINPGGNGFAPLANGGFVKTDDAWVFGMRTTVNF